MVPARLRFLPKPPLLAWELCLRLALRCLEGCRLRPWKALRRRLKVELLLVLLEGHYRSRARKA